MPTNIQPMKSSPTVYMDIEVQPLGRHASSVHDDDDDR